MTEAIEGKGVRRLIAPPPATSSLPFVAIRDEFLAICGDNHCEAALLSAFETWTVGRLDHLQPDWTPDAATDHEVWIRKSHSDLVESLKRLFCARTVATALKSLVQQRGFLVMRSNPDNGQDRTKQYRFAVTAVAKALVLHVEGVAGASSTMQDCKLNTSNLQDEDSEFASSTCNDDVLNDAEMQVEADENAATVTKSLIQTPDKTLEESLERGEERASREAPPADADVSHPLIDAFLAETPEACRPPVTPALLEAALALEATTGARDVEIRALVAAKYSKPRTQPYLFEYLADDLPKWRGMQLKLVSRQEYPPAADDDPQRWQAVADAINDRELEPAVLSATSTAGAPIRESSPSLPLDALDVWQMTHAQLREQLDRDSFSVVFRDAYLLDLRDGVTFVVALPTQAARDMAAYKYQRRVLSLLHSLYGSEATVEFEVGVLPPEPEVQPVDRLLRESAWVRGMTIVPEKELM